MIYENMINESIYWPCLDSQSPFGLDLGSMGGAAAAAVDLANMFGTTAMDTGALGQGGFSQTALGPDTFTGGAGLGLGMDMSLGMGGTSGGASLGSTGGGFDAATGQIGGGPIGGGFDAASGNIGGFDAGFAGFGGGLDTTMGNIGGTGTGSMTGGLDASATFAGSSGGTITAVSGR